MSYLERNAQLISEISSGVHLKRRRVIGEPSTKATFTNLGSYTSSVYGRELFLGLKEYRSKPLIVGRFLHDLAFIRKVAITFPHLECELPVIFGLLRAKDNQPLGIIMEDFSKAKRHQIINMAGLSPEKWQLPYELSDLIDKQNADLELAEACFFVGRGKSWHRKIGDFDTLCTSMTLDQRVERFSFGDIMNEMDSYTIKLNYEL